MEQTTQLLSNLIVSQQQHLILIIDDTGHERTAQRILRQFLSEQGQEETSIKTLPLNNRLNQTATFARFLTEIENNKNEKPLNVLLPTLADLLCYQHPAVIFEFLYELRNCENIQRSIIWASTPHLIYPNVNFLLSACEYLCDAVLHFIDEQNLSFIARKPGGGVIHKTYKYKINKNEYLIQTANSISGIGDRNEQQQQQQQQSTSTIQPSSDTFKIELEEEELVARNAMKLPYEKTSEDDKNSTGGGGNIVYTPDATDDFDDEDPDEDLCI